MIIGFWTTRDLYFGGINYISNLIESIVMYVRSSDASSSENPHFYIFTTNRASVFWVERLSSCLDYVTIVKVPFLSNPLLHFFSKLIRKLLSFALIEFLYLKFFRIDVLSHSTVSAYIHNITSVGWIPDFNHFFTDQWSSEDRTNFINIYSKIYRNSSVTVLSSQNALSHFNECLCLDNSKIQVLPFYLRYDSNFDDHPSLSKTFNINSPYCVLPNQFWPHKNHLFVLDALTDLLSLHPYISFVFIGNSSSDPKQKYIFDAISSFAQRCSRVHIFSDIEYNDVLSLIRNSVFVINPSLFEGWSTTVMEAMLFQKTLLLSNLEVHKEQANDYPNAIFFDPYEISSFISGFSKALQKDNKYSSSLQVRMDEKYKTFGMNSFQLYTRLLNENSL